MIWSLFSNQSAKVGQDGYSIGIWFISKEITLALGYENNSKAVKDNVESEDITTSYIPELSNNYTLINESGLYSLILRSQKPEAKKFKKWVTSEVLPSIRKHGVYSAVQQKVSDGSRNG